jgi:hypothetical protein
MLTSPPQSPRAEYKPVFHNINHAVLDCCVLRAVLKKLEERCRIVQNPSGHLISNLGVVLHHLHAVLKGSVVILLPFRLQLFQVWDKANEEPDRANTLHQR